jgi:phage baseplate assembly protein W
MAADENKEFLGRGWSIPVALDPITGLVAFAEYQEDIRQAIRIIVETAPGERVMRPDFGCGIHDLVFASPDAGTLQRVQSVIEDALRKYEARIDVLSVLVQSDPQASDGRLWIEVEYRVRKTNQVGNFVFPFYFNEGGANYGGQGGAM